MQKQDWYYVCWYFETINIHIINIFDIAYCLLPSRMDTPAEVFGAATIQYNCPILSVTTHISHVKDQLVLQAGQSDAVHVPTLCFYEAIGANNL